MGTFFQKQIVPTSLPYYIDVLNIIDSVPVDEQSAHVRRQPDKSEGTQSYPEKSPSLLFHLRLAIFSWGTLSCFLVSSPYAIRVRRFPKRISPGGRKKKALSAVAAFGRDEKAAHCLSRRQQ